MIPDSDLLEDPGHHSGVDIPHMMTLNFYDLLVWVMTECLVLDVDMSLVGV